MGVPMCKTREEYIRKQTEMYTLSSDASRYLRAQNVLINVRKAYLCKSITAQQYKTIRGQAISGDVDGAAKGLSRLLGVKA